MNEIVRVFVFVVVFLMPCLGLFGVFLIFSKLLVNFIFLSFGFYFSLPNEPHTQVREELINMLKNKETEQSRELSALQQDLEHRMSIVGEVRVFSDLFFN